MNRQLFTLTILFVFIHPSLLHAQRDSRMQDSSIVIQPVVIQSNRIQSRLTETSANVISLDATAIRQLPAVSVAEILHYVAGVDIRQRGAQGVQADPGIRGSTFDQVLILVNGIKLIDPQTGHHSLNLPLDLENIQSIQVIKGSSARVYGQNTFAGAINIITKNPTENFIRVQGSAGSFGTGGIRLSAALNDTNVSHYVSANRDFSDGYQYNTDFVVNNYFYQGNWNSRAGTFELMAGLTDREFGANGFYASPNYKDQRESVQTSVSALSLKSVLYTNAAGQATLQQRVYWRRNSDDYILFKDNPTAYRNQHTGNTIGYEANALFPSRAGLTGLGVDINRLMLVSSNLGDHARTVVTVYAEHRVELFTSKIDITPGVQLNYFTDFGMNVLPGIDAGYSFHRNMKLYANAGYTFRVPTYTDLYYQDPSNVGNPDLTPEYAFSYEAGIKVVDIHAVEGQVSYFVREGKDIIDWSKENEADPWKPENLQSVTMQGWDMNFSVKPGEVVPFVARIDAGYTYIDAEKRDDVTYSRYALENLNQQLIVSCVLRYGKKIQHSVSYRYTDRQNLPAYNLFDTRITYTGKTLSAFADVTNLTDVSYKETNLVTMPGRWFKLGVSYKLALPGAM